MKLSTGRVSLLVGLSCAMWAAYVHGQFGQQPAKLTTIKLRDDLFVIHNDYVPGNTTTLVTTAGGGSSKEWTSTLDDVLQLDFDAVVPGHGTVTTKPEMRKFRDSTPRLRTRVHELIVQKKTRDDISKMLQAEFHWAELHLMRGLDGIIVEN